MAIDRAIEQQGDDESLLVLRRHNVISDDDERFYFTIDIFIRLKQILIMRDSDIERAHQLAENALHDSVTPERLTETDVGIGRNRLHDDPVYRYLESGEQPHFFFYASKETPIFNGPAAPPELERSRGYRVIHVVTNSRWLMIAGHKAGDQTQEFRLEEIQATNFDVSGDISDSLSNSQFVIELPSLHCTIPIANEFDEADLRALSTYLRDEFGAVREGVAVDSDEAGYTIAGQDSIQYEPADVRSRIDRLPDEARQEADTLAAEANSVEELIRGLDELLDEHEDEERTLDDVVADASSVDQIRRDVETPQERAARQARDVAKEHIEPARDVLNNADPEEVGKWGLNVGKASLPVAVAANTSTPLLIIAALAVGGAAGLHASGVKESPLADISPDELSSHVLAMAESGRDLDEIDGETAGALLGAFTYLGGQLAPEEFVKWIEASDPEAILAGANAGISYASRNDVDGSEIEGAVAGGGLGLLGSYAGLELDESTDADEDLAEIVSSLIEKTEGGSDDIDE